METKLTTAADLLRLGTEGHRFELVRGVLREISPLRHEQGRIAARLTLSLFESVAANQLGEVFSASTGFLLATDPDHVRGADAAFVRRERLLSVGPVDGFWPGAPDVAVEAISAADTFFDVEEKVLDWLDAGTRLIVVANPAQPTLTLYRSTTDIRILRSGDILDATDVVQGWRVPVDDIVRP